MSRSPGPAISGPLLRLFGEGSLIGLTEHELLDRFRTAGDEQAFEALVDRHGPMVLSVCRRVLGPGPDAEDAFQATFLVLARNAGQLRSRHLLGPWLHRVALRASWRAAAVARRRRRFEGPSGDALDQMVGPDDRPDPDHELLHREIDRLPASYRRVVLLCDLSGHSHSEAASLLGWPLGTVKGRHFRARELLRSRLARLGLAVSAVMLAQAGARASIPAGLAARVAQAATRISYAGTAWLGVSAIPAERLMKGVLVAMILEKIKLGAAVLVPTAIVGLATMAGAARWQEDKLGPGPTQSKGVTVDPPFEGIDLQPDGSRGERVEFEHGETISTLERDDLINALSGRWVVQSIEGGYMPDNSRSVAIFKQAPDQILSTLGKEGVPFLVFHVSDVGADPGDADPDYILIASKSKHLNLYDTYSLKSIAANPYNIRPDTGGIFQREGDLLRMASTWNGVRPSSFSLVGTKHTYIITNRLVDSNGASSTGIADDGTRRGDDPKSLTPPEEPVASSAGTPGEPITNPLVGLWELESVDGRAMPAGIYLKMVPSPVLPTSEEDRESTWLVLKSISVGNNLPYAYADQFVAVGGGEEKRGFNCYTPGSLANAKGPSPATRGEYRLEEGGKLTIATALTAPRPGAVEPSGGPLREIRVYHRVEGDSPKVEEAEAQAAALPEAGDPIAPDPIERKEAAVGEMVRTHDAIREIRGQLKELYQTSATETVTVESTRFQIELMQEEIREQSAELRKLEKQPAVEEAVVHKLRRRMNDGKTILKAVLRDVTEAESKVEQAKREIERLNDELDALYRERKAAGDTLERP